MKIRRKDDPLFQNYHPVKNTRKVVLDDGTWGGFIDQHGVYYNPDYWEAVPDEPELVDVTTECMVVDPLNHPCGALQINEHWQSLLYPGHEWRKIEAYVLPISHFPGAQITLCTPEDYKQTVLQVWGPQS